jgi:serine/threonine protein kinase
VKVSDFGLSRDALGDNKDFKLYSKLGTEGYKPPEMEQGNYTGIQADLFATGVVLFLMYNGTPPFLSTKPHDKIYKLIRDKNFVKFWSLHERSKPPGFYPDSFKRLMNSFFSAEPDRRPTFESLNDDEWLKSDELMLNEVRDYMQAKYDKIAETDLTKKKIAAAKKEICLKQAMEE